MKDTDKPSRLNSLLYLATQLGMALLILFDIGLPWILRFFYSVTEGYAGEDVLSRWMGTGSEGHFYNVMVILYLTSIPVLCIAWKSNRVMKTILNRDPFCISNRRHLRTISWCGAGIGIAYFLFSFLFSSHLMLLAISAAAFMLSVIFAVLTRLIVLAAEIKEENDMTI